MLTKKFQAFLKITTKQVFLILQTSSTFQRLRNFLVLIHFIHLKFSTAYLFIFISLLQIILSQEKQIQKLKALVQSLQEQLLVCRGKDDIVNDTTGSLTELLNELNHHQIME